ncbi:MAG: S9 family peptidase [Bacteroidetes bacterium]|nr:S9 family peptidase [Bacteroidota bacterium]
MKKVFITFLFSQLIFLIVCGQKKPLDPTVYDRWESIGEKLLSPDGKFLVYTVTPQEGDGRLVVRATGSSYAKEVPRGYSAGITADGRYLVFLVKPFFKDTREARIKKKKPEESPKDTLVWMELGTDILTRIPKVKSYKIAEKEGDWLAYLSADSTKEEGTAVILRDMGHGNEKKFAFGSEYTLSKKGNVLVVETTKRNSDSLSRASVLWVNTGTGKVDTVMKGFQDAKSYALDEAGGQLAFVAQRDSAAKALVKWYRLWYYAPGMDSAVIRADRGSIEAAFSAGGRTGIVEAGRSEKLTVSADFANYFSKDGSRLFFGMAPVRPPKDTNLVDFETARLDVWTYKDDYLSPQQLVQLNNELKRSYLAVWNKGSGRIVPLADGSCETVFPSVEGTGRYALGMSSKPYRIQQQWEQNGLQNVWLIDVEDGSRKMVQEKVRGEAAFSPEGKYIFWYDWKGKNWFTYEVASGKVRNITSGIKFPLYDEEDDHPDDPPAHGTMGWLEGDRYAYIYDRYDIWQCDPMGAAAPVSLTRGYGRRHKLSFRGVDLEENTRSRREADFGAEKPIKVDQQLLLRVFDQQDMSAGFQPYKMGAALDTSVRRTSAFSYSGFVKAKNNWVLSYLKGSPSQSNDVYCWGDEGEKRFSQINPQQADYNWMTVELHHWKMFDGKMSEGLLYKPENFDSTKKYPVIFYFYERDAETRYQYIAPQPVRASINVPFFVSNGYIVFDPDIFYKTGQPGEDAYNSVVSAARYLSKFKWVDTTKMAIQGHSWGGYQVAYLITRTNMFAAAEAGAPVANMTSAYGGIRWSTGISREFQYEKSQSRIGATLWQKPELYIKNSPLFKADKVQTPLLMMHNDADGAVPWYQGIEYFSALRRLGKKVWLMQYNGEDHGLVERRNRKDWSMRLFQFFGYYLKGDAPARWITDGVPATLKGIDWGLQVE